MSREIKFRGKRIVDGDWFYGNLITEVDGDFNIKNAYIHVRLSEVHFSENSLTSNLCLHEIDPETVGQYTGRKDVDGVEIYEDDKLFAPGNLTDELQYVGTVVWDEEDARFETVSFHGRFEYITSGCVVKGNVHVVSND